MSISKYCDGCGHLSTRNPYASTCDYMLDTGKRRPCPAGDGCSVHTKISNLVVNRRKSLQLSWNAEAGKEMFRQGKSDAEIAKTLGISVNYFKNWRQKNGMLRREAYESSGWNRDIAEKMVLEGKSDAEIAEVVGAKAETVASWRRRAGYYKPAYSHIDENLARKMFAEGASDAAIGRAVGKSRRTIERWRLRNGLFRSRKNDKR